MKQPLGRDSSEKPLSLSNLPSLHHHGLPDGDLPAWNTQNSSWDVGCPSGLSGHPLPIPVGNVTVIFRNAPLHRRRYGITEHKPATATRLPLDSTPPISSIGLTSVAADTAALSSLSCWPGDCLEDLGDGSLAHVGGEDMASIFQVSPDSRPGEQQDERKRKRPWECNLRLSGVGGTISQLGHLPPAGHSPCVLLARCGHKCVVVKDWLTVQKLEFRHPLVHVCPGIVSTAVIDETLGVHDWDIETGSTVNQNLGTNSGFKTCAWSLHPRELWVVDKGGNCSLWDLRQRKYPRGHLDPLPFSRKGAVLHRPECYTVLQHPKDPRVVYLSLSGGYMYAMDKRFSRDPVSVWSTEASLLPCDRLRWSDVTRSVLCYSSRLSEGGGGIGGYVLIHTSVSKVPSWDGCSMAPTLSLKASCALAAMPPRTRCLPVPDDSSGICQHAGAVLTDGELLQATSCGDIYSQPVSFSDEHGETCKLQAFLPCGASHIPDPPIGDDGNNRYYSFPPPARAFNAQRNEADIRAFSTIPLLSRVLKKRWLPPTASIKDDVSIPACPVVGNGPCVADDETEGKPKGIKANIVIKTVEQEEDSIECNSEEAIAAAAVSSRDKVRSIGIAAPPSSTYAIDPQTVEDIKRSW